MMVWSSGALKATLGVSGLAAAALWWDWTEPDPQGPLDPAFLLPFFVAMGPFLIFLFIRPDEVSPRVFRLAARVAVIWCALILVCAFGLMAWRGVQRSDLILGPMLLIGVWPCVSLSRRAR